MLININRATNIDEISLLNALETGTLASAAIGVFDEESTLNPRFLQLDYVLLRPHTGSGTFETRIAMTVMVRENLLALICGRALFTPAL